MAICTVRGRRPGLFHILLLYILVNKGTAISPDGEALLSFSNSILSFDGILPLWRLEDPDPCNWRGVTCDQKTKRVIFLSLKSHKLSGPMSLDLGKLEHLRIFFSFIQ